MGERPEPRAGAERIVVDARLSPDGPVRAFAVTGGRIVAVGPPDEILALRAETTEVVGASGRRVVPGLHDGHTHLAQGALETAGLDLRGAPGPDAVAERVRARAAILTDGAWIRGFGWDASAWGGARPSRAALDRAAPVHPVFLGRADGHAAWLNTAAFRALGVDVGGAPGFGERAMEGVLEENAADEARARIPRAPARDRRALLREALREAARLGLTAVDDVADADAVRSYLDLRGEGPLPVRVAVWLPLEMDDAEAGAWRERCEGDPWLAVTTRKVFVDGTFGGRSAALERPYRGSEHRGDLRVDPEDLARRVGEVDALGWAVAFHAVGDRAVRVALDAIARLPDRPRLRPHRIEHAQAVRREDLGRIAAARVAISVQPVHWKLDRAWAAAGVPGGDGTLLYPWRSLREAASGALAAGSDWPVAPLDPGAAFRAAAERRREEGSSSESLDSDAMLEAYTAGAAAAGGLGGDRGRIAPGHRADFLILADERGPGDEGCRFERYVDGVRREV